MSTRSRAPNGRFATTNATTDPTGGGGQADTEPDLSANTETEPPVDQGAAPDPGHLAGQGGEGAGTDTDSSTEPSQDGSGSDDEEDLPTDKDQSDPAKAFRKAAEDGIRDWLDTVTSKDERGRGPARPGRSEHRPCVARGTRGCNVSVGWRAHLGRRLAVVCVCARVWRVRINKTSVVNCCNIHFPIDCPVVLRVGLGMGGA